MVATVFRCFGSGDPLYEAYHDREWGRPVTTERGLFQKVCLEGFQAGLSWQLILRRREALVAAFAGFDPDVLAGWGADEVASALDAEGMIRSAAKVRMVVTNAIATLLLREGHPGGLAGLVWEHAPTGRRPAPRGFGDIPALTLESTALAKALKRSGFSFVGPTTVYALMQADGLVNDHLHRCPVRAEVERERREATRARKERA
jgi:DNA-3-methyladenine glycosylase I